MEWVVIVVHTLMAELLYRKYGTIKYNIILRLMMAISIGAFLLWSNQASPMVALGVVLTYISIVDYTVQKIPNTMVLYLFFMKLIDIVIAKEKWFETSVAFLLFLIVMLILYRFSKGGLGAGDVKLIAVLAFYLGIEQTCVVLILACGLIVCYALVRWLFKKQHWKASVPMAPFVLVCYIAHSVMLLGGI